MAWAFLAGVIFAVLAYKANLFSSDQILAAGVLKNFKAIQILLFALSVSSLAFFIEYSFGVATINVKPFFLGGIVLGGLLFGIGVGILGYCPGTLEMAIGYGKIDAIFGYLGGLLAGYVYIQLYPKVLPFLGPDYGSINFYSDHAGLNIMIVTIFSVVLFVAALRLQRTENKIIRDSEAV